MTLNCHLNQRCRAIIMENKQENDLLVHGFVRNKMEKYNINIPFALIGLFAIWNLTEYVHVIGSVYEHHCKINVDKIIKECKI